MVVRCGDGVTAFVGGIAPEDLAVDELESSAGGEAPTER